MEHTHSKLGLCCNEKLQVERLSMNDMRAELEKLRRETKALEGAEELIKAKAKREDEAQRKLEREKLQREAYQRSIKRREEAQAFEAAKKKQEKEEDTKQRQDRQLFRRQVKVAEHQKTVDERTVGYLVTKKNADHTAELQREKHEREQVEQEQCIARRQMDLQSLAARKEEEVEREEAEQQAERASRQALDIKHQLQLALEERDAALESLDYMRFHEQEVCGEN